MANSTANITLYSVYGNAGFIWPLVVAAISMNIPAILGLFFNSALIWVTHRTKTLKETANYLLALCSFFELLHQHGHLLFLYMTLSGLNFLPYGLAVRICAVSLFGLGGIPTSMAFTGLDRLLAILFPKFHKSLNTKLYLGTITFICCFLCAIQLWAFIDNNVDPALKVTGRIGDFLQGFGGFLSLMIAFPLYNISILLYILVGIVLKYKIVPSSANDAVTNRVFRSLFIIITLNVGGYYINYSYRLFIMPNAASVTNWFLSEIPAILLNFGAASNAPVLYFISQEYRKAFQREFPFLAKFSRINPITTIPPMKAATPTVTMTNLKIKSINVHQIGVGVVVPNRGIHSKLIILTKRDDEHF